MTELRQVIVTPDGAQFETRAEAMAHMRKPQIRAALLKVVGGKEDLADWLLTNQEAVEVAFEVGTIRRVTKVELNRLKKALDAIVEAGNPKFGFVTEHKSAIVDSFRWPSVKRMTDEEKATAARNSLVAATEGNEELAKWILDNKDAVLEAFEAGKEKREVNPKATEALAAYRAKKAAEKAAGAPAPAADATNSDAAPV